MKSMTRRRALAFATTALASIPACQSYAAPSEKSYDQNTFLTFSPDFETLKKSIPSAVRWWTVKFDGRTYHFCREEHPFIEVSRYDVHGWYQAVGENDKRLFHVWSIRTHGIGDIRVDIDEAAGIVSVVSLEGRRKMKGKQVAFYALGSADP